MLVLRTLKENTLINQEMLLNVLYTDSHTQIWWTTRQLWNFYSNLFTYYQDAFCHFFLTPFFFSINIRDIYPSQAGHKKNIITGNLIHYQFNIKERENTIIVIYCLFKIKTFYLKQWSIIYGWNEDHSSSLFRFSYHGITLLQPLLLSIS